MTDRFHSLRHGFEAQLKQNLYERSKEAERITALLQDVRTPHAGASMDLLARHARGWLLVAYSDGSGLVSHLVPVVEAWIEHGFHLSQQPNLRKNLLLNVRAEDSGVHLCIQSETSNISDDTIDRSEPSWHTFMMGAGRELYDERIILSYHASKTEAIADSGIDMTSGDESHYENILSRLLKRYTMSRVKTDRIHR